MFHLYIEKNLESNGGKNGKEKEERKERGRRKMEERGKRKPEEIGQKRMEERQGEGERRGGDKIFIRFSPVFSVFLFPLPSVLLLSLSFFSFPFFFFFLLLIQNFSQCTNGTFNFYIIFSKTLELCLNSQLIQVFSSLFIIFSNIHHWFNITDIIPHSSDDGSLELKCYSVNFVFQ